MCSLLLFILSYVLVCLRNCNLLFSVSLILSLHVLLCINALSSVWNSFYSCSQNLHYSQIIICLYFTSEVASFVLIKWQNISLSCLFLTFSHVIVQIKKYKLIYILSLLNSNKSYKHWLKIYSTKDL